MKKKGAGGVPAQMHTSIVEPGCQKTLFPDFGYPDFGMLATSRSEALSSSICSQGRSQAMAL
jgi:hypothetical protein